MVFYSLLAVLSAQSSIAANCNSIAESGLKKSGADAVAQYSRLLNCDKSIAEDNFEAFIKVTGDVESLVSLAMTAINAEAYNPVWKMLESVPYSHRENVARGIGGQCANSDKLGPFLQGAYYALHGVQFGQWEGALVTCELPTVSDWILSSATNPPSSSYDPKYEVMLKVLVQRQGAECLPSLEAAAVKAAENGGPFPMILEKMNTAVKPSGIGVEMSDENKVLLTTSLTNVAQKVDSEHARAVADRLFNAGSEAEAASLLPRIYADKLQGNGSLIYGMAAIEQCEDRAIVHWTSLSDPGKRWSILSEADATAVSFKAKLKCEAPKPWPVVATPEPLSSSKEIEPWAKEIGMPWAEKGNAVKLKKQKDVVLD